MKNLIAVFTVCVILHFSLAVAQKLFAHKPSPLIDYAVFSAVLDREYSKTSGYQIVVGDTTDSQVLYSFNFRYADNAEFGGKRTALVNTPAWLDFLKSVENWTARRLPLSARFKTSVSVRLSSLTPGQVVALASYLPSKEPIKTLRTKWSSQTAVNPMAKANVGPANVLYFSPVYCSADNQKSVCATALYAQGSSTSHIYFLEKQPTGAWRVVDDWITGYTIYD